MSASTSIKGTFYSFSALSLNVLTLRFHPVSKKCDRLIFLARRSRSYQASSAEGHVFGCVF
jgi:hypothetical protein